MEIKKRYPIFSGIDSNFYDEIIRICHEKFNFSDCVIFIKDKSSANAQFIIDKRNIHIYLGFGDNYNDFLENLYIYRFLHLIRYKTEDVNRYDFIYYHSNKDYLRNLRDSIVLESYHSYVLFAKLSSKVGNSNLALDTYNVMKLNFPNQEILIQKNIVREITRDYNNKYQLLAYQLKGNARSLKIEFNRAMAKAEYKKAIVLLEFYLKVNPSDAAELRKLGIAYYKSYDNKNAYKALMRSKEIQEHYSTEYFIGITYYNMMRYDKAIYHIDKAISMHPAKLSIKKMIESTSKKDTDYVRNQNFIRKIQNKIGFPKVSDLVEYVNYKYMLSVCYMTSGNKDKYIEINNHIIKSLRPDFYKSYEAIFPYISNLEKNILNKSIDRKILLLSKLKLFDNYVENNNRIVKYHQAMILVRARLFVLQGNMNHAEKDFLKAYSFFSNSKSLKWLGYFYLWTQDYVKAIEYYSTYLSLKPKDTEVKLSLAFAYLESGAYKAAQNIVDESYDVFISTAYRDKSHLVRRNLEYAKGNIGQAWKIFSDRNICRNLEGNERIKYSSNVSKFSANENILMLAEWGPGDEIRWASIYSDLAKKFTNLSITCEPRLFSFFSRSFPNINFIPTYRRVRGIIDYNMLAKWDDIPNTLLTQVLDNNVYKYIDSFDQVCLLSDALAEYRKTPYSFSQYTYAASISICPIRKAIWKNWIQKLDNNINVGICWKSGLTDFTRNVHYTEIQMWQEVFSLEGINFINLQYANYEEDISFVQSEYGITIHHPVGLDLKNDFEGLAALMSELDFVVSPTTTIAEFSGLLGVPTLLTSNSRAIDWRVIHNNHDIWFKSIKHIRADRDVGNYKGQASIVNKVKNYLMSVQVMNI